MHKNSQYTYKTSENCRKYITNLITFVEEYLPVSAEFVEKLVIFNDRIS